MKKNKKLFCAYKYGAGEDYTLNIGDVVQTLASSRFLPKIDYFIDRDNMKASSTKPPAFLISNGWFIKNNESFPPPQNIYPFYISFHIAKEETLTPKIIDHLKRHSPIGCRDISTYEILKSKGIESYLSGCLTTTLKSKYASKKNSNIFLVDLDHEVLEIIPEDIKETSTCISHRSAPKTFKGIFGYSLRSTYTKKNSVTFTPFDYLKMALQKKPFDYLPQLPISPYSWGTRLHLLYARKLLDQYAQAKLVITKRIHCALPCLAFGTPVILIRGDRIFDHSRLSAYEMFQQIYHINDKEKINWSPKPIDISTQANFLEKICLKAIEIQDNPLKYESLDKFK